MLFSKMVCTAKFFSRKKFLSYWKFKALSTSLTVNLNLQTVAVQTSDLRIAINKTPKQRKYENSWKNMTAVTCSTSRTTLFDSRGGESSTSKSYQALAATKGLALVTKSLQSACCKEPKVFQVTSTKNPCLRTHLLPHL